MECFLGSFTGLVVLNIAWVVRILTSQELILKLKDDSRQFRTREHLLLKNGTNFVTWHRAENSELDGVITCTFVLDAYSLHIPECHRILSQVNCTTSTFNHLICLFVGLV